MFVKCVCCLCVFWAGCQLVSQVLFEVLVCAYSGEENATPGRPKIGHCKGQEVV